MKNQKIIRPQAGQQEKFLSSQADICVYGGAAGSGKSWALCLECLRHINNPKFGAALFRRTSKQVRSEGGLWDRSCDIFPYAGGQPRESILQWRFPSGAKISFAHLEHEKDKFNWDGSEIALIGFDELIHFTKGQFFYMLSRNRSTCGITPYIRATTNPDSESCVAEFIAWWIGEDGYPIPERSGVLRWFYRIENTIHWFSTKEEAIEKNHELAKQADPKSVTFIAASVHDNPALLKADPSYLANLQALPKVERERLLKGNWKIHSEGGNIFNRAWFKFVDELPTDKFLTVRYWDKAGVADDSACETVGVKMSKNKEGQFFVEDVIHGRWSSFQREKMIRETAKKDGKKVEVYFEQEPGSAGLDSAAMTIRNLAGYTVKADRVTGDKLERAMPLSAQVEAGNVFLLKASWNRVYMDQMHGFPNLKLKDMVDASSGAFNVLAERECEDWSDMIRIVYRPQATPSFRDWRF